MSIAMHPATAAAFGVTPVSRERERFNHEIQERGYTVEILPGGGHRINMIAHGISSEDCERAIEGVMWNFHPYGYGTRFDDPTPCPDRPGMWIARGYRFASCD